jgi:hypothetical protein
MCIFAKYKSNEFMSLTFQDNGNLPKGVLVMTIDEFELKFGFNDYRKKLIVGLKLGISHLKNCGCKTIYIDGSFVTKKEFPGDFDACWDATGVDINKLKREYGIILDFLNERANQKSLYLGEFFPAQAPADHSLIYFHFFQKDKDNNPKGIVQINLN